MKRRLMGLLAAGMLLAFPQASHADGMEVPKDIYQWVQSTARADYYFNRQQMGFRVGEDGIIDLDTLIVPTIRIYDQAQIQDVVSKRRWKMLPMDGYGDLVGAAEYLAFRLKDGTVQVTEHDDLDSQWGTLGKETGGEPVRLDSFSELDVNGKFYRAILAYAEANRDSMIARSYGRLSDADRERLEAEKQARLQPAESEAPDGKDKKSKKSRKDKKDKKDKKDRQAKAARQEQAGKP